MAPLVARAPLQNSNRPSNFEVLSQSADHQTNSTKMASQVTRLQLYTWLPAGFFEHGCRCSVSAIRVLGSYGPFPTYLRQYLRDTSRICCWLGGLHYSLITPQHPDQTPSLSLRGDLLYYRDNIFVVAIFPWCNRILQEFHSSPMAGHSGFIRKYKRVRRNFNWPGLKKSFKSFVSTCDTCKQNNYVAIKPPGLLQPLPIPSQIWTDIAMDFIESLL